MSILDEILCALIKFLNMIVDYLLDTVLFALGWLLGLLPSFPVKIEPIEWGPFGQSVGYFLPVDKMMLHFTLLLGLMALWYSVQHIMRWIKMIK